MSHSRTAFVWTLTYPDPLMAAEVVSRVRETVATWIRLYPGHYSNGWVTGEAYGLIQAGITIRHRDQWAVERESRRFARALAIRAKVTMVEVATPQADKLQPHQHRGARRFEAPKYQVEASDGP